MRSDLRPGGAQVVEDLTRWQDFLPGNPCPRTGPRCDGAVVVTPDSPDARPISSRPTVFELAACLHWGWIRNADDVYLDPLLLVDAPRPVRLLPLWRGDPVR